MNNFSQVMETLNKQKFTESELETILTFCNKKLRETTDEHDKNEMYHLINDLDVNLKNFINSFKTITFYEKNIESLHSYNIMFKYEHFNITLSHKIAYCSEFGGISIDNTINIIDIHQETCYNLWGEDMFSRFINILNLETNINDVKKMINLMFKAYQPDENNIKW